jgi:hypothetical protein
MANDIHTYAAPGLPIPSATQFAMIGEYGGLGAFTNLPPYSSHTWTSNLCYAYQNTLTEQNFVDTLVGFLQSIQSNAGYISAAILTQITDVETECDGMLNYDRTPKFNGTQMGAIYAANQQLIQTASAMWSASQPR